MIIFREEWRKIGLSTEPANFPESEVAITRMYEFIGLPKPTFIHCKSPLDAQYHIAYQRTVEQNEGTGKVAVFGSDENLEYCGTEFWGQMDAYWIAFYEFAEKYLDVDYGSENSEKLSLWSTLAKNCSWFWCFEKFCFISDRPEILKFSNNRMHSEDGPAIRYRDGYEIYFWNGVEIEKQWIEDKESITKEQILKIDNAEKRRCLREILGAKRYYDIIAGKDGLKILDEDYDDNGNLMTLYETTMNDSVVNRKVQFLSVICPSTGREYNLYPSDQQSKNVFGAKSSTFNKEKIAYRHGDVGLLNLKKPMEKPIAET